MPWTLGVHLRQFNLQKPHNCRQLLSFQTLEPQQHRGRLTYAFSCVGKQSNVLLNPASTRRKALLDVQNVGKAFWPRSRNWDLVQDPLVLEGRLRGVVLNPVSTWGPCSPIPSVLLLVVFGWSPGRLGIVTLGSSGRTTSSW